METLTKSAALSILGQWKGQDGVLSALVLGHNFSLSSRSVKVVMCLDGGVELVIPETTTISVALSGVEFSRFKRGEFATEPSNLVADFEQGICIVFPENQMRWYLFGPTSADSPK